MNIRRVMRLAFEVDRRLVTMYYLTAAAGAIAPIAGAFLFKLFLDHLAKGQGLEASIPLVIVFALAGFFLMGLIESVVYWGLNVSYYDYLLRNRFQAGLTQRHAQKLAALDLAHLEDPEINNLMAKVENTFQWQIPDFVRSWNYMFVNILTIVTASLALLAFAWWIPLVVLSVSLPRIYFKAKHGNFAWSMFGSGAPDLKKLWYVSWLLTSTTSIIETRIFRSQPALMKRMRGLHDYLYDLNKKPLDKYRWVVIIAPVIETLTIFVIAYHFLPMSMSGALSIGSITFVITTLGQLRSGAARFTANVGELYQSSLFVGPFFELMALPKLVSEKRNPITLKGDGAPRIEFKNVSFAYPNGTEVLRDISFVIKPGESLALVGVNGAGKTTLIKLLCRFYDVSSGQILINGVDLKDLKLDDWYKHLGTLFQDFVHYNFSVRDNIMLGAPDINDEERMRQAAEQSGAYEFIKKFENGFDQMLGRRFEQGEELSGGQWQKLAIARALYQQAPVLIMDEPTSAIDAQAEYEIFQNLEKVYKGKTLILVSHRFSTVRNANKIIVIDNGQVIESGTHEQLLEHKGKYAKMFHTQAKGYK